MEGKVPFLCHIPWFVMSLPFFCKSHSLQSVTDLAGFTCDSSPSYTGFLYLTECSSVPLAESLVTAYFGAVKTKMLYYLFLTEILRN